jgi:hypothetical protein
MLARHQEPPHGCCTVCSLGPRANAQTVVNSSSGSIDYDGNISMTTQTQKAQKNVLHIEYQFNGEKLKKSALEESVLILP